MMTVVPMIGEVLMGLQTEILVFVIAIAVHTLVFGKKRFVQKAKVLPSPTSNKQQKGKAAGATPPKRQQARQS